MKVVSFFAGAGGLDLGFTQAGFDVVWANEYDKTIWETFRANHPHTFLDTRSITAIEACEVPTCDGIIGGPPCQSWSEAGTLRGIQDKRGQLFFDFIRILKDKQPRFFLAENVPGMLHARHAESLQTILELFASCGYDLSMQRLNAADYGVPQDRKRVFFVGYRQDLKQRFQFPRPTTFLNFQKKTLHDAIADLQLSAVPALPKNKSNHGFCEVPNHEYMTGGFSTIYMSRNRVRAWDEVSYTIQAGGRHAPLHPQAPKMIHVGHNQMIFDAEHLEAYRRLSVRECARIQTFPDDFIFHYKDVAVGYKMVGNAVPVALGKALADKIMADLSSDLVPALPLVATM
jgi:DNA (cytosine-5)-methyltransferase 1